VIDTFQGVLGGGAAGELLLASGGDVGVLRPFVGADGRSWVTLSENGKPRTVLANAPATLPYDSWKHFDDVAVRAMQQPILAWRHLREAGLVLSLPNGMAQTMLQYNRTSDITGATVSMHASRRGEADRPEVETGNLPIPIVHKDFDYDLREILAAQRSGMPLDTTSVELAGEKIGQALEEMTLGIRPLWLNGVRLYGYLDLPERATKSDFTVPTASNLPTIMTEILALSQLLINDKHYGPYRLYMNNQWATFLDTDFSTAKGDNTLRQRVMSVGDIEGVFINQYLPSTNYTMVLVEMKSAVARAVIGVDTRTVQWETLGGMRRHFKVMAVAAPHVRPDSHGNSGVAVGTSATA
jgi:uncharacterized linocin/CFP29 family protein